jgi:polyisoprenoid-binding protein YceI
MITWDPSTSVIAVPARWAMERTTSLPAALTIRGRTRPLSFVATASVPGDGEVWLDAEVRVHRADFGITWNVLGMVSQISTLAIHAVFTRDEHR